MLVTAHRRASFGDGLAQRCDALRTIAEPHPDVEPTYPVHPNPNVINPVRIGAGPTRASTS